MQNSTNQLKLNKMQNSTNQLNLTNYAKSKIKKNLINQENQILEQLRAETNPKISYKLFKQLQSIAAEIFNLKYNIKVK